jgi:hypothetical protein
MSYNFYIFVAYAIGWGIFLFLFTKIAYDYWNQK